MPSGPRTEPIAGEATDAGAWHERLVELTAHRVPGRRSGSGRPFTFYELEDGSRYVHYGARANPLVSAG